LQAAGGRFNARELARRLQAKAHGFAPSLHRKRRDSERTNASMASDKSRLLEIVSMREASEWRDVCIEAHAFAPSGKRRDMSQHGWLTQVRLDIKLCFVNLMQGHHVQEIHSRSFGHDCLNGCQRAIT
jgi:hypothetical protein